MVFVAVGLFVLASSEGMRLYKKNQEYGKLVQELEANIRYEEDRRKELEEYREYTKTDEFAKWYAKHYFGLIRDNEIIIKGE